MSLPVTRESGFVIPLKGSHVRETLTYARGNQETFGADEWAWLSRDNKLFWLQINTRFNNLKDEKKVAAAEAMRAGMLLANHAVRVCVKDDPIEYRKARINYFRNREIDDIRLSLPGAIQPLAWDVPETLTPLFGDPDLVASLMEINAADSRHSAAIALAYFCLAAIPE